MLSPSCRAPPPTALGLPRAPGVRKVRFQIVTVIAAELQPSKFYGHSLHACYVEGHYLSIKFHALSCNIDRERHHEPIGATGLDEKELNGIKHQGFCIPPPSVQNTQDSSVSGHHILPRKSVGFLLLFTDPGELEKFLLWRWWILRTIQWNWWRPRWFNVEFWIFK